MGAYALAQAGDSQALSALVRQHIPLVQALCRRFSYCEDAFQQGCMGLVQAIRRFQEDSGHQFSTYAVPLILGEMRRAFSHTLGWRSRAALKRAKEYRENQQKTFGRDPSVQEIAAAAGVDAAEIMLLMERDQPAVYDITGTLLASLPDPASESWLTRLFIRDILNRMPQMDAWLIRQRFFLGHSQSEIALALGANQSTVSRLEKRARHAFQAAWQDI